MAGKTNMAFDPEQTQVLADVINSLATNASVVLQDMEKNIKPLGPEGDVIGECEQKEPINMAVVSAMNTFGATHAILKGLTELVTYTCEQLGIAVNQNIKTADEAAQAAHAQAQKVLEHVEG